MGRTDISDGPSRRVSRLVRRDLAMGGCLGSLLGEIGRIGVSISR